MMHVRLDLAYWESVFQLDRLIEELGRQLRVYDITGPYEIAVIEQQRVRSYAQRGDLQREPTDIFVWNRGEPENRAVTKISGLPYRAAGKPWPTSPFGMPLNFVAQINFADSRDLVPALPGDLFLIFIEGKEWRYKDEVHYNFSWGDGDERDSTVVLEWATLGNAPLVSAEEVPETPWRILPCYGAIHRSFDYPDAAEYTYPFVARQLPAVFGATKIGGVCPWLNYEDDVPGTYLCSLSSIQPEVGKPFPYLNVPEPITYNEQRQSHALMLGDVGFLNFYMNSYGDVHWVGHSH
jgi:hypothetical protein